MFPSPERTRVLLKKGIGVVDGAVQAPCTVFSLENQAARSE